MMQWPPDYHAETKRRIKLHEYFAMNPPAWENSKTHYSNGAQGCIDWINDFCVTYDPRNKSPLPKVMPFMLFEIQDDFIHFLWECYINGEDGLIEKCRDMGASWLCVAFTVWLWIFHEGSAIGWGSRKEEYVDKKGDPKAIFPKIRMILENLPEFTLPKGFNMDAHAPYMKIMNPENGSTITGEAGDNIGRGGRTSMYFKDESAHYERPDLIEAALGDNTNVQIDISSVNGSNNVFYRRRMAGEIWKRGRAMVTGMVRVFIMQWQDHPAKTKEWYERRRAKAEREGLLYMFAQEVDRDYSSSVDRQIIEMKWINACVDAHIKLGFDASGAKVGGQDVADEGGDKNALAIVHGVILQFAEHWGGDAGDAATKAVPICTQFKVRELFYDSIGVGSGFKTGINNMKKQASWPRQLLVQPWNAGAKVLYPESHIDKTDPQSPTNADFFGNLKAQAWWSLRTRCYKTYRAMMFGEVYDPSQLVSFPSTLERLHEIKMELSQAIHKYNQAGKTIVDKKPDGSRSPNLADAVVMAYYPARELSIFDVL